MPLGPSTGWSRLLGESEEGVWEQRVRSRAGLGWPSVAGKGVQNPPLLFSWTSALRAPPHRTALGWIPSSYWGQLPAKILGQAPRSGRCGFGRGLKVRNRRGLHVRSPDAHPGSEPSLGTLGANRYPELGNGLGGSVALVPGGDRGPVRDGMEGHENGKWKAAWIDATQAYTFLGKDPDLESETSSLARTPELL